MNIVVLDGYTLNPGDLKWDELSKLGNLKVYDRSDACEIHDRAIDADILLTNKTLLKAEDIALLPNLKYIGLLSTGTNAADLEFARSRNIPVTNVPTYSTNSVAQMTFALLLEICNKVAEHNFSVKKGEWSNCLDFCYLKAPLIELEGKTIGIIGFGNIGQQVAKLALAFGMKVLVYRLHEEPFEDIEYCNLERLLNQSDIISLHCPLTKDTEKLINNHSIQLMKDGVIILNTGRGGLIDESALADGLNSGKIYAAGLDVLYQEPPVNGSPLINLNNCFITPHISWASKAARERLYITVIENIKAFLNGTEKNVVN